MPLRVCYFGTYRAHYVRNRLMIERLRLNGIQVTECHATLWRGIEDREQIASGGWLDPRFWWRVISAYCSLLWRYFHTGEYDILIVGYPGQPDIPLARVLSWIRGKPLVWDVLMSIYLISLERGLDRHSRVTVSLIKRLESLACRLPDRLILDTQEYAAWFCETYRIPPDRIRLLPLGADDRIFLPAQPSERREKLFRCVYYGTYIPNHGVDCILEAARLLKDYPDIQFELIGRGPDHDKILALSRHYGLKNVTFIDWMDVNTLVMHMNSIDVCLGTFGITPQALMTMQNKIHEGLAMAKPIINGDSPVMRSTLRHGEHIFLCERRNPLALAEAILTLRDDPILCEKLARQGYTFYQENFTFQKLGLRLKSHLMELVHPEKLVEKHPA